jgi:hypothetical protein
MPICGACVAYAKGSTIMATIIRRTDKHEQLSFRVQVRRLAPSSENSLSIRTHTLESKENVTLPPCRKVGLDTALSVKVSKNTCIWHYACIL